MSQRLLKSQFVVAALSLACLLVDTCSAQQRRSPFGTSRVSLATLEPVQSALSLNDEQKALADSLHDKLMEDRRAVFQGGGGDFDAMRVKMEELDAEATAKFSEKLDEKQKTRLTEIFVQANGPNALADKQVMESIKITSEQSEELDEVREENREEFFEAFQDFQDMSDDERREAFGKLQQEADDRLLDELSEEQRTAFEKLSGKIVEFDLSQLRGGFGGGGGGGGGRPATSDSDRPQRPE